MASACTSCRTSLMGKRYVLRDEAPTCLTCYETSFANKCEKCKQVISTDAKDLTYKDQHYHENCFLCYGCNKSLANQQFVPQGDALICMNCYEGSYAEKCECCKRIFKHGTQKVEYDGKNYHYECFVCSKCRKPIGDSSFMPHDGGVTCMKCHNDHFASKCGGCAKVIAKGGVKFGGVSYHRQCFVCNGCKAVLAGAKFATQDGRPFCPDCYMLKYAKRCHHCKNPIAGLGASTKFCSYEGRYWHTQCFNCTSCTKTLMGDGFLLKDNQIVCSTCGYF